MNPITRLIRWARQADQTDRRREQVRVQALIFARTRRVNRCSVD